MSIHKHVSITALTFWCLSSLLILQEVSTQGGFDYFGSEFGEFLSNVLIDTQFGDGFLSELLQSNLVFENERKSVKNG